MSLDYGQRHSAELVAARRVAEVQGVVEHKVMPIDLTLIGGSALTDSCIEGPDLPAIRFFCLWRWVGQKCWVPGICLSA